MRKLLAFAFVGLLGSLGAADDVKKSTAKADADGWIDLMKPDVWKKVDSKWIITDEVKLAPNAKAKTDAALKVLVSEFSSHAHCVTRKNAEAEMLQRDDKLSTVLFAIQQRGFGCSSQRIGDTAHLLCSCINSTGGRCSPSFWISISSQGEWFISTWNDDAFIIPNESDVVDVALSCFQEMDRCMSIPDSVVLKYSLKTAQLIDSDETMDISSHENL